MPAHATLVVSDQQLWAPPQAGRSPPTGPTRCPRRYGSGSSSPPGQLVRRDGRQQWRDGSGLLPPDEPVVKDELHERRDPHRRTRRCGSSANAAAEHRGRPSAWDYIAWEGVPPGAMAYPHSSTTHRQHRRSLIPQNDAVDGAFDSAAAKARRARPLCRPYATVRPSTCSTNGASWSWSFD